MPAPVPVTIVIVEDDPGHARLLERNLRRAHITNDLMLLRDGQAALDYLYPAPASLEAPPDLPGLLLLDLGLPMVDGYQVLEWVKRDARTHQMLVIVLTTVEEPADLARCAALGCHVFLRKPAEPAALLEVFRQVGVLVSIVQRP